MSSSTAIRAGRAYVELLADNSKLQAGLRQAQANLRSWGAGLQAVGTRVLAVGAAGIAAATASVLGFGKAGDQLAKMAKRTGFAVEALGELKHVAELGGTSVEDLETSLRRMQRSLYDAGRGLSTATDALSDLGLSVDQLAGMAPEEQFVLMADALSKVQDDTRQAAIAMTLFGRSGTSLLPMIEGGAEAINALRREARQMGLVMSTTDAAAAEELMDAFERLRSAAKMVMIQVGAALAPALKDLADWLRQNVSGAVAWVKEHRPLVVLMAKGAAAAAVFGGVLVAMGFVLQSAAAGLGLYTAFQTRAAQKALAAAGAQQVLQKATISHVTALGAQTVAQQAATAATAVDIGAVTAHAVAHTRAATAVAMHALALRGLQMQLGTTALAPATTALRTYTTAQLAALSATKLLPGAVKKSGGVFAWFSATLDAGAAAGGRVMGRLGTAIKGAFGAIPGILAKVGTAIAAVFKGIVMLAGAILTPIGLAIASVAALVVGLGYAVLKARAAEKAQRALEERSSSFAALSQQASQARADVKSAQTVDQQTRALERLQQTYTDLAAMEREHQDEGFEQRAQAYEKLADEASGNLQTVRQQMQQTSEAAQGLRDSIDDLVGDLKTEAATFGMSSRDAAIYKLQMQGATAEQLKQATALSRLLDRMDQAKAKQDKLTAATEDYNRSMFEAGKQIVDAVGTPAEKRQVREAELQRGGMTTQQAHDLAGAELAVARAQERADQMRQAAESDDQNRLDIAELQLRTKYKGLELEQKLLELEHQRARAEAQRLGGNLELVDQEFALRRQLAEQAAGGLKVAGSFSGRLVAQMGGLQHGQKIAKATEETARTVKQQLELTRKGKGLVFQP